MDGAPELHGPAVGEDRQTTRRLPTGLSLLRGEARRRPGLGTPIRGHFPVPEIIMKHPSLLPLCAFALLAPLPAVAAEANEWTFDVSVYALADGMSGTMGIGPVNADIDVGLDDILQNLEFGFMGTARVGYGPWALTLEGLYMGVQGAKNGVTAELDQCWSSRQSVTGSTSISSRSPESATTTSPANSGDRASSRAAHPKRRPGLVGPDCGRQPETAFGNEVQPQSPWRRRWLRRRLGFDLAGVSLP